jgi:hypothetical protein
MQRGSITKSGNAGGIGRKTRESRAMGGAACREGLRDSVPIDQLTLRHMFLALEKSLSAREKRAVSMPQSPHCADSPMLMSVFQKNA